MLGEDDDQDEDKLPGRKTKLVRVGVVDKVTHTWQRHASRLCCVCVCLLPFLCLWLPQSSRYHSQDSQQILTILISLYPGTVYKHFKLKSNKNLPIVSAKSNVKGWGVHRVRMGKHCGRQSESESVASNGHYHHHRRQQQQAAAACTGLVEVNVLLVKQDRDRPSNFLGWCLVRMRTKG